MSPSNKLHRVSIITVLPSPYQRDLFRALAARQDIELNVYYLESEAAHSPWPKKPLLPFERVMPGLSLPFDYLRGTVNWRLPKFSDTEIVVVSTFTSVTGQWLMRRVLPGVTWVFWGERLRNHSGIKEIVQRRLVEPISKASGVVGIGRAAEQDYSRRFPHLPHFCIPYHCELSDFIAHRRQNADGRPLTFLYCGQMIYRKGVDILLHAFQKLVDSGTDARLLLVGREADLPKYLAAIGSEARFKIIFEGFQAPDRLPELFQKSDVFVLPSRHDGWGVVINQALGAGLPIITSDAVGAGIDLVDQEVNGLQVPAGDTTALLAAMTKFTENPSLVEQWGRNSLRKAADLTPECGAQKWVEVFDYLECVRPNRAPGAARHG